MKTQLKAKKHLGQNFLVNKHHQKRVLVEMQKIVNTKPELPIVEIGVGQGDLTVEFAKWGRELKCLEIDTSAYDLVQFPLFGLNSPHSCGTLLTNLQKTVKVWKISFKHHRTQNMTST